MFNCPRLFSAEETNTFFEAGYANSMNRTNSTSNPMPRAGKQKSNADYLHLLKKFAAGVVPRLETVWFHNITEFYFLPN
jgi:hypothetical protein